MVSDAGFQVGMHVVRKADGTQGRIKSMTAQQVILEVQGKEKAVSSMSFIQGLWKQQRVKSDAEVIEQWANQSPSSSLEFYHSMIRGRVFAAMYQKMKGIEKLAVDLTSKPKSAVARIDFKKGQLKIPVISSRVDLKQDGAASANAICVGTATKD